MKCGSKTSLQVNSEQLSISSEDASAEFAICDKPSDNSTIKPSIDLTKSKYMQQTIDTNIITSDKLKAEIIWALFSVCKGYLNNSAKSLNQTFAAMFPDSPTTQQFQLGSDKLKYICNWGIAPYFKSLLETQLAKSEYIVVSFSCSFTHLEFIRKSC